MILPRTGLGLSIGLLSMAIAALIPDQARAQAASAPAPGVYRLYIGTYTGGNGPDRSRGIYLLDLDTRTGELTEPRLAAESTDPSFLAIHPNGEFLYAANESGAILGRHEGGVSAFAIDSTTGKLTPLNQQLSAGSGPCHLIVDHEGKNVLVANYGSGSFACLPIGRDGKLQPSESHVQHQGHGTIPARQAGPHAHSVNLDPANRFAFVADLGLDGVYGYAFNPSEGLLPRPPMVTPVKPGSGPRHFAFHPSGRFAYVINEMANTINAFAYDADSGVLSTMQVVSTLPDDFHGQSWTADIHVHPSGRFLYGSNRGHDSIAIFAIDPTTGRLTPIGHESTRGKMPRNFTIDPTGAWLLAENQDSDSIVAFRIDPAKGTLTASGRTVKVARPVCIQMIPKPPGAGR